MLKTANHQTVSFGNGAALSLDFRDTQVSVSDSNGGDRITITGLRATDLQREISYYCRLQRWSHDKESKVQAMQFLTALAEICREGLEELNKCETAAS